MKTKKESRRVRGLLGALAVLSLLAGAAVSAEFDTLIAQGKDSISLRRFAEGEAIFNKALKIRPGHPEALYGAGACAQAQGAVKRALGYYGEVLKGTYNDRSLRAFHSMALQRMGEIYITRGDADQAVTLYRQGVKNEPDSPEMHYGYGMALRVKGLNEMSLQQFEEAIRLNPNHALACVGKAAVLFDMGKVPEAFSMLDMAIRLAPMNPTPYGVMSRFYAELKKPYEEKLSMGSYYYGLRMYGEAEKEYRAAMKLKDTGDVRHTLGAAQLQQGKLREAEDNIRKAISKKVKPEDPAWAGLSNVLAKKKPPDFPGAFKAIEKAIKLNDKQAAYQIQLAWLALQAGDDARAERAAKAALKLQPGQAAALRYLGDVYNKRGKLKDAIDAYEKCIAADTTMPDVYVNLGWAYEQAGDLVSARRNYEMYLRMNDDPTVSERVREQIRNLEAKGRKGSGK